MRVYSRSVQVHLAQYNTATLRRPLDDPASATYVALLDEVNALAEASPGFVWRHGIDSRDSSTSVYDDPQRLVNASVWESLEALRDYAYRGFHRDVFRRRQEWFVASDAMMWWIRAGTIPSLAECVARLEFLERYGPTPFGFETGQRHPQFVITTLWSGEPDTDLVADAPDGTAVHVAFLDGRAVGAAHLTGAEVVTRVVDGIDLPWLPSALDCHVRTAAG